MTPQQLNAYRLADYLEEGHSAFNGTAAEMLRRQHEAIRVLREALERTRKVLTSRIDDEFVVQALKNTEEFQ